MVWSALRCVTGHALLSGAPVYGSAAAVAFHCDTGWAVRNEADIGPPFAPDLSDPDTLAAFDRRLALRLGEPADLIALGCCLWLPRGVGDLWICVGVFETPRAGFAAYRRTTIIRVDTDDPLLARVRAWKSVTT